jgi:hypothetical protein
MHIRKWCRDFQSSRTDDDDDHRTGRPSTSGTILNSMSGGSDPGKLSTHHSRLINYNEVAHPQCTQHVYECKSLVFTETKFLTLCQDGTNVPVCSGILLESVDTSVR